LTRSEAELKANTETCADDNFARGMSPEEARHDAHVRSRDSTAIRERVEAVDSALGLIGFGRNVRYALRQLRRE
jgi:hypothetical protein